MKDDLARAEDARSAPATAAEGELQHKPEPSYYAKNGIVWKSPIVTHKPNGGKSITIGFPVCKMHDAAEGQEGVLAEMLNRSELVDRLLEALKPFAKIVPSSLYADTDNEAYEVSIANFEFNADFTREDLMRALAAVVECSSDGETRPKGTNNPSSGDV